MTEWTSGSPEETRLRAEQLAAILVGGELIFLEGTVGAGKTVFAQGLGRGLGVNEPITSPSFAIISSYEGRLAFHHVDLYRLSGGSDAEDLGLYELLKPSTVVVVEWPERAPAAFGPPTIRVRIELEAGRPESRRITILDRRPETTA